MSRQSKTSNRDAASADRHDGLSDKHFKLMTLSNDNYDAWDRRLQDIFYALDWLPMHAESLQDEARADNTPASHRRKAWGLVKCSLDEDMAAKVDDVQLGEVESLLRRIRKQYYKDTIQVKSKLRRKLENAKLEDHADLGAYIAHIKVLSKRLQGLGTAISAEDKQYRLLEGLPSDYDMVKQAIKLPREQALTWEQIVFMLEDFADNPRVPGSGHKHRSKLGHGQRHRWQGPTYLFCFCQGEVHARKRLQIQPRAST